MAEFKLQLHENAQNVEQIEDYWFRRRRAKSGSALVRADMQFLVETSRADESIYAYLVDKSTWAEWQMKAKTARHEDGDLTLWTQIWERENG